MHPFISQYYSLAIVLRQCLFVRSRTLVFCAIRLALPVLPYIAHSTSELRSLQWRFCLHLKLPVKKETVLIGNRTTYVRTYVHMYIYVDTIHVWYGYIIIMRICMNVCGTCTNSLSYVCISMYLHDYIRMYIHM